MSLMDAINAAKASMTGGGTTATQSHKPSYAERYAGTMDEPIDVTPTTADNHKSGAAHTVAQTTTVKEASNGKAGKAAADDDDDEKTIGERIKAFVQKAMRAFLKAIEILGAAFTEVVKALKEGRLLEAAIDSLIFTCAALNALGYVVLLWKVIQILLGATLPLRLIPFFNVPFFLLAVIGGLGAWHWIQMAEMAPSLHLMSKSKAEREFNRTVKSDGDAPSPPPTGGSKRAAKLHKTLRKWNDHSAKRLEKTSNVIYLLDWVVMYFTILPFVIMPFAFDAVRMLAWIAAVRGFEFLSHQKELFREKYPEFFRRKA